MLYVGSSLSLGVGLSRFPLEILIPFHSDLPLDLYFPTRETKLVLGINLFL
jgi:hypothetical protein